MLYICYLGFDWHYLLYYWQIENQGFAFCVPTPQQHLALNPAQLLHQMWFSLLFLLTLRRKWLTMTTHGTSEKFRYFKWESSECLHREGTVLWTKLFGRLLCSWWPDAATWTISSVSALRSLRSHFPLQKENKVGLMLIMWLTEHTAFCFWIHEKNWLQCH